MKNRLRIFAGVIFLLSCTFAPATDAQVTDTVKKESGLTKKASGQFEVKLTPRPDSDTTKTAKIGGIFIDKEYSGGLEGKGRGEMLTAMTDIPGSAGYVALEKFTGTLNGRKGSFVLQHSGIMTRGEPHLVITVVPDSGTDELTGISGSMAIEIAEGKHSYTFDYVLPNTH